MQVEVLICQGTIHLCLLHLDMNEGVSHNYLQTADSQCGWETGRHMYEMWVKLKWTFQNQISSCLNSIFIFELLSDVSTWGSLMKYVFRWHITRTQESNLFGLSKLEIFRSSLHSASKLASNHIIYISLPNINFGASDFERLPAGAIETPNPSQPLSLIIMNAKHSFRARNDDPTTWAFQ